MPKREPHDVLGVERGAGMAAIKAAWRQLARAHHPDVSAGDPAAARAATARMAEINAAYDILRQHDAERRAGLRSASRREREASAATPPEPSPRRSGPPRARPTRPVTGRVDTSATFRPRNTTTGPGLRMNGAGLPPRPRTMDREPPRASEPTGPLRRHRIHPRPVHAEPSLAEAVDLELAFGKFHGHTLGEVADFEPSYIDWLASTMSHNPDLVTAARVVRRRLDELGIRRQARPMRRPLERG